MRDVPSNTGSPMSIASLVALWADSMPLMMPLTLMLYCTAHPSFGTMYLLKTILHGGFWFHESSTTKFKSTLWRSWSMKVVHWHESSIKWFKVCGSWFMNSIISVWCLGLLHIGMWITKNSQYWRVIWPLNRPDMPLKCPKSSIDLLKNVNWRCIFEIMGKGILLGARLESIEIGKKCEICKRYDPRINRKCI